MKTDDFDFDLADDFIAKYPLTQRSASKLLCLEGDNITDQYFTELPQLLNSDDVLIFNNTKVIPARLFAQKKTGGKVEILIERIIDQWHALAHIKANKSLKLPCDLMLENHSKVTVLERQQDLFKIHFQCDTSVAHLLQEIGHMPLPPYMQRRATSLDQERYQTVYAKQEGAVAAPTAGLHFDDSLLTMLKNKGIQFGFLTLHVGAGTFKPVVVSDVSQHQMHYEYIDVSREVCDLINNAKEQGRRIIAVGTTTVRALETAMKNKTRLEPYQGETNIFIYPGYDFLCIDALITNFHLPKSTLLMLVCALGGHSQIMKAYEHAKKNSYRFYSYGDAMLINARAQ